MVSLIESLPLEVLYHILTNLPLSSLFQVRLTSKTLSTGATSNPVWQHFSTEKWKRHKAMMDVLLLPPTIFVFSKLPTGWFRAYKAMLNVSQENWLRDETDVHGTKWLLYFKQHLTQSGPGGLLPPFHAIIEWTRENTVTALEGLPLTARSKWQVLEGGTALVVSAYPPHLPSRDKRTWMRVLENYSLFMVSDSPEFLDKVMALDEEMCFELGAPQPQEMLERCAKIRRDRAQNLMDRLRGVYREALSIEDFVDAASSSSDQIIDYRQRNFSTIPALVHESSTDSYESVDSYDSYGPGGDEYDEDGNNNNEASGVGTEASSIVSSRRDETGPSTSSKSPREDLFKDDQITNELNTELRN